MSRRALLSISLSASLSHSSIGATTTHQQTYEENHITKIKYNKFKHNITTTRWRAREKSEIKEDKIGQKEIGQNKTIHYQQNTYKNPNKYNKLKQAKTIINATECNTEKQKQM